MDALGTSHVGHGIPSHTRESCILNFKESDLVHTLGEFAVEILDTSHVGRGILKICGLGRMWEGSPPPTPGSFCILKFKESDLVHTLGEFAMHYLSPYTFIFLWRGRVFLY